MAGPSGRTPKDEGADAYDGSDGFAKLLELPGEARMRKLLEMGTIWDTKSWTSSLVPHLSVVAADDKAKHPWLRLRFTVQPEHCNGLGNMHGGCTATLFDYGTSMSLGLVFRPGAWMYLGVSRTLNATYLRPIAAGDVVLVESEVIQAGRNLCALRSLIRRESDGIVLATCEHNKANTDPPVSKI